MAGNRLSATKSHSLSYKTMPLYLILFYSLSSLSHKLFSGFFLARILFSFSLGFFAGFQIRRSDRCFQTRKFAPDRFFSFFSGYFFSGPQFDFFFIVLMVNCEFELLFFIFVPAKNVQFCEGF